MALALVEKFDPTRMSLLLSSGKLSPQELLLLKTYHKKRTNGNEVNVNYHYPPYLAMLREGRVYADNGLSLGMIQHDIRNCLVGECSWDVDMVNAHPVLLKNYADSKQWACPALSRYVNDRDNVLQELEAKVNYVEDRNDAKTLMRQLLYLGPVPSVNDPNYMYLAYFRNEMGELAEKLALDKPHIATAVAQNKSRSTKYDDVLISTSQNKKLASTLSISLGSMEYAHVSAAMQKAVAMGREVRTYIYDGFTIARKKDETSPPLEFLQEIESVCPGIQFAYKPMTTTFKFEEETESSTDFADMDLRKLKLETRPYEEVKVVFETTHFFVKQMGAVVEELPDGRLHYYTTKLAEIAYGDVFVYAPAQTGDMGKFTLMYQWLKDPTKRAYDSMVFAPPPAVLPPHTYNTFRGFAADLLPESVVSSENVEPFKYAIGLLVNKIPKHLEYVLKYLAHLIQKPGDQSNNVMIFFYSPNYQQGVGKSINVEMIGEKLLGKMLYMETSDFADIKGGHATAMANRLLIQWEEATGKDSFANRNNIYTAISARTIHVNPKNIQGYDVTNYVRFMSTTNSDTATGDGRRFIIFDASFERAQDTKYFGEFCAYMDDPCNQKAIIAYLRSIDISDWNAESSMPKTYGKAVLKRLAVPHEVLLMRDQLMNLKSNYDDVDITIGSRDLVDEFIKKYVQKMSGNGELQEITPTERRSHETKIPARIMTLARVWEHLPESERPIVKKRRDTGIVWVFRKTPMEKYLKEKFDIEVDDEGKEVDFDPEV